MRSFALILCVWALSLSAPSLNAEEPTQTRRRQPQPAKSKVEESYSDQGKPAIKPNQLHPSTEFNSPKHQPETDTKKNKSQDKTTTNNGEGDLLAVFNGLLTIFTLLLVYFGYRQAKATEMAANAAKTTADVAKESVTLAREEFIATHRPQIIVRRISIGIVKGVGLSDFPKIEFILANTGQTRATIVELSTTLWIPKPDETLPAMPPYGESQQVEIMLDSGMSIPLDHFLQTQVEEFSFLLGFSGGKGEIPPYDTVPGRMYFFGYVMYKDGLNRPRRTAFCRAFDSTTGGFSAIEHPDYEYQD